MLTLRTIGIGMCLVCVGVAAADVLVSWGDGQPGTDYSWSVPLRTLLIREGNGNHYRFWVHDGSGVPGTGTIEIITVDPNAVGDFTLLIGYPGDPNDPNGGPDPNVPGALHCYAADLRMSGLSDHSTVTWVKVAGVLSDQSRTVILDQLGGSICVGGNLLGDLVIEGPGPHTGDITIAGSAQDIQINNDFTGDVSIGSDLENLSIDGSFTGSIDIGGASEFLEIGEWASASPAHIHFGDYASWLALNSDCLGDVVADATLRFRVHGDLSGSLDIAGWGSVIIYGDVLDSEHNHVRIGELGKFECDNMRLSSDPNRWLTFGPGGPPVGGQSASTRN